MKARHDPFRLAPFRTRTHALPVFMQVIYLQRGTQQEVVRKQRPNQRTARRQLYSFRRLYFRV